MSNNNGKISAPVSIDDVKSVLGYGSNDLAALCTYEGINMWAKYKPTSYGAPFPSDWYKSGDGNFGITFPNITAIKNLISAYTTDTKNGYSYKKPSGGSSSPYRLGDFRGYNKKAAPPVNGFYLSSNLGMQGGIVIVNSGGTVSATISTNDDETNDDTILKLSDITAFSNTYFGIAIVNPSSGAIIRWGISDTKISAKQPESFLVTIKGSLSTQGTFKVYPFLAKENVDIYSISQVFYPVPYASPQSIRIISNESAILVEFTCWYKGGGAAVASNKIDRTTAYVKIVSNESSKRYTNCKLNLLRFSDNAVIESRNLGTISPGFSNKYTFTGLDSNMDYSFALIFSDSGTTKTQLLDETTRDPDE